MGRTLGHYRNNVSKRPPQRYDFAREKGRQKTPRGKYHDNTGAFSENRFRGFWPLRAIRKNKKKGTHLSKAGRYKQSRKKAHTSHTHTAIARRQQVLIMPQPSITDKAPITDKSTDDQSNSWGSLRRPGEAAPTREGTPASVPASERFAVVAQNMYLPTSQA